MCCWTHEERDRQDGENDVPFTLAENEDFRCRCPHGARCQRRMTEEDWLCDWCRGRNHETECDNLARNVMRKAGDPRVPH